MFKNSFSRVGALIARAADIAVRFHNDTRANVLAVVALSLIPLIGALALGSEAASWNVTNRGMQNAADSAAVAAATAGYSGNTAYTAEGYTVAARYGFTGSDHTSGCTTRSVDCVSVLNGQTCPDATTGCYQVTISQPQALLLTQVLSLVGFNGDTTVGVGGAHAIAISATSVAEIKQVNSPACLLALQTGTGYGITINGGSKGNLAGCTMASASSLACNGANGSMGAGLILYVSSPKNANCTPTQSTPSILDPYAATLPSTTAPPGCNQLTALQAANLTTAIISSLPLVNGSACLSFNGNVNLVGDASGNVTTPGSVPTQIYINNGSLNGSATLVSADGGPGPNGTTLAGAGATLIFSGTTGGQLSSSTNLNLSSPQTGIWAGFTIVDPLAGSISYSGNTPTWDLSGIVYFPNMDLKFSGVPNKAGSGYNCFILVTNTVQFNGTAQLYANPTSGCKSQGSNPPQILTGFRAPLVS